MINIKQAEALQTQVRQWKSEGLSVALVPTMGALHAGHLSLVKIALEKADRCVVSIFVNPAQFAPHEDFESYPRDLEADIAKLGQEGAHVVYMPSEEEVYPDGQAKDAIKAGAAAQGLETDFRPHFFDGVVNVVHRLFGQVQPDIAVFGEKDYQQLQVIQEMVEALDFPMEIIAGPVIRDEHGLALSSRNEYLSAEELVVARQLNVILQGGDLSAQAILDAGFDKVDYVERRWGRVLAAVWVGQTRLIDNIKLT